MTKTLMTFGGYAASIIMAFLRVRRDELVADRQELIDERSTLQ